MRSAYDSFDAEIHASVTDWMAAFKSAFDTTEEISSRGLAKAPLQRGLFDDPNAAKTFMKSSPSLAGRAALALVLMIGFYVLALATAAALLYIPYAEWHFAHRLHVKLALLCVVGGLLILWAIIPRIDRFLAPGPRLTRATCPRLFTELESVANGVNQEMPAEVYLVH